MRCVLIIEHIVTYNIHWTMKKTIES
jgi:hypothetical protein